jgi:molybdopterin-guanine dinucleotide biosynthesis protein A
MLDRGAVTAIVLAGGRSSRFGSQKLAADLDGAPLLDHVVRAVAGVAGEVVVAGAPSPSIGGVRLRHVIDEIPFAGPLAGLELALRSVTSELAIVVGGDMPGLVPAVLEAMLGELAADRPADAADALVLHDGARRQLLPLALRVEPGRRAAAIALQGGDRSLIRFLDRLRCRELSADTWRALDPVGMTLADVDVPADLDRFRTREIR